MNQASNGKVNTVVKQLVITWRQLIRTESNIQLFASLLKKGISTRDVYSFATKQAKLRKVCRGLDKPLTRAAMRCKLNDACAFCVRLRHKLSKLRRDLLRATDFKRFKQKKILKQVRDKMHVERLELKQKNAEKLKRYEAIQSIGFNSTGYQDI